MNPKLAELAYRREILISRSAAQREQLAQACRRFQKSMRFVTLAVGLIQTVKAHPALALGVTALFVGSRRSQWEKLPLRLWTGWQILRPLRALWSRRHR